jgi:hypothetical protein
MGANEFSLDDAARLTLGGAGRSRGKSPGTAFGHGV